MGVQFEAQLEAWRDRRDGAPTITVLWGRTPRASRPHLCDHCCEEIAAGEVYQSQGWKEDGEFKSSKTHRWSYHFPSGCPRFRIRDAEGSEAPSSPVLARDEGAS